MCNDKNGYVVYAKGITQNSLGEPVLSSPIGPNYDIKTGNLPSGNGNSGGNGINNSTWALKLNPVVNDYSPTIVDTYNNKYAPVPSDYTKVASRASGTSTNPDISNSVKSAFTTTYAVYTTPSQPAGTYSGQVQFMLLHPSTADNLATTIDNAFFLANKTRLILKTDGTTVEEGSEGSEDIPAEDIVGRYYKMQDMDTGICSTVTYVDTASETQLIDIRDNKTYYVTKLQDGNCWMTQNLALDLETTPTNVAPLTSENTDLNDNSLGGAYSQDAGYDYDPATNILSWRPANSTKTFSGNSVSGWIDSNSNYATPSSARKTDGTLSGHQATGNYYNWTAAIASNNSTDINTDGTIASNSICPKGWRLPNISKNEFGKLNNLYNAGSTSSDAGLTISPLWLVRSGVIKSSSLQGDIGFYWSSRVRNNRNSYFLFFTANTVNPSRHSSGGTDLYYFRSSGSSLRCLAR